MNDEQPIRLSGKFVSIPIGASREYRIAFMKTDGSWDIVREFISLDDSTANEYAEEHYGDQDWFVLDANGRNINGGAA